MKTCCIIQARTGSTRLPSKVLKKIQGKEILLHDVDRVLNSKLTDLIIVATTVKDSDDKIVNLIDGYHPKVKVTRGSEEDLLDRYYQACVEYGVDVVIRITSDCPLIDWNLLDQMIEIYLDGDMDYVSNTLDYSKRGFPRGLDTEVFSFKVLKWMWENTSKPEDREHVTWYIKQHPDDFKTKHIENDTDLTHLRWTLDEEEDFLMIKAVYDELYPVNKNFLTKDILNLLEKKPEIAKINAHVEQKKVEGKDA